MSQAALSRRQIGEGLCKSSLRLVRGAIEPLLCCYYGAKSGVFPSLPLLVQMQEIFPQLRDAGQALQGAVPERVCKSPFLASLIG